ncbi:hypothetical protein B0H14DRAFT_2557041 [Mycena olivaceomarginata]|nr:hypothetical protein B0H14DRAFT_2557041 [Mycena olivaceomarginata]
MARQAPSGRLLRMMDRRLAQARGWELFRSFPAAAQPPAPIVQTDWEAIGRKGPRDMVSLQTLTSRLKNAETRTVNAPSRNQIPGEFIDRHRSTVSVRTYEPKSVPGFPWWRMQEDTGHVEGSNSDAAVDKLLNRSSEISVSVSALPAESVQNISVPDGATTHGDPHTLCTPASAFDVVLFYLTNYFAHAVTVKLYAGEAGMAKYLSYVRSPTPSPRQISCGVLQAIVRRGGLEKRILIRSLTFVVWFAPIPGAWPVAAAVTTSSIVGNLERRDAGFLVAEFFRDIYLSHPPSSVRFDPSPGKLVQLCGELQDIYLLFLLTRRKLSS